MIFSQHSLNDIIFCLAVAIVLLTFITLILVAKSVDTQYSSHHKWRTIYPNRTDASVTLTFGKHLFSHLETIVIDYDVLKRYRYAILCLTKDGIYERRRVYLDLQNIIEQNSSNENLTISKLEYRPIDSMRKTLNGYESPEQTPDVDGEIRIVLSQMKGEPR